MSRYRRRACINGFRNIKGPHQEDICYATQNRQNAVKALSKLVDVILVIGSPNSSNSNRLRELGEQCGIPSYLDRCRIGHQSSWLKNAKAVGIAAGASAPEVLVTEVVAYLKRSGPSEEVEELTVIEEDVEFLLPKELVTIESASCIGLGAGCLSLSSSGGSSQSQYIVGVLSYAFPNRRIFLCIFEPLC